MPSLMTVYAAVHAAYCILFLFGTLCLIFNYLQQTGGAKGRVLNRWAAALFFVLSSLPAAGKSRGSSAVHREVLTDGTG